MTASVDEVSEFIENCSFGVAGHKFTFQQMAERIVEMLGAGWQRVGEGKAPPVDTLLFLVNYVDDTWDYGAGWYCDGEQHPGLGGFWWSNVGEDGNSAIGHTTHWMLPVPPSEFQ